MPLLVDEAWGSHLRFSPLLPASALECDADLVLSSVHKLLGSLTQSAILHLGGTGAIDEDVVDRCVTLTESTSPSALLTASLDAARRYAAVRGEELLAETLAEIERIRAADPADQWARCPRRAAGRPAWGPRLGPTAALGRRPRHGHTGTRLAALMRERDDINVELASENVSWRRSAWESRPSRARQRFVDALRKAVEALGTDEHQPQRPFTPPPPWGSLELPPREAFLGPQEVVPFAEAVGRVAAESLAAYPPGIPNVLPGERLTRETVDYINEVVEHGGRVRGAVDRSLETIRVVASESRRGASSAADPPWGVDSEHGRLLDVLVCPPDNFRWLPTSAISRATLDSGQRFDAERAQAPARRDGRRLRGGRRASPLPRPRPGASLPGVCPRLQRDDAEGRGDHPAHQWWRRGEYAPVDPLLPGERDPDSRHDHRRARSRAAT